MRDTRGASSDSFTAFFASGNAGGAGVGGGGDCFSRALALRDRVEAEHASTLAVASATPPPRRARVFYLGDDTSVWSVAFAEGPKASRRCALPPPPREAEGAVPARLRVAATAADASADDASASAAGKEKARTRVLTKELFRRSRASRARNTARWRAWWTAPPAPSSLASPRATPCS